MAGAVGVVITTDVPVSGQHAQPVYVDDSLPIVGPSQAIVVTSGEVPQMGGPPLAVRLAPAGTPALGPALPVYVVPGGGSLSGIDPSLVYTNKVIAIAPANLIAYWPQAESSGSTALDESGNGRNGAYTGVTLAQPGIGDGRTAASFDGSTSYNNIYSASLAGAFTPAEGTIALWFKVSGAGVWTDAVLRRLCRLRADASNDITISKNTTNGEMAFVYTAGGTIKSVVFATASPTGWTHAVITWSKAADQLKAYLNGAQVGATQTGLGTWVGALASTLTLLGAGSQPANVWSGLEAHAALWTTPLSASQVASLATVP